MKHLIVFATCIFIVILSSSAQFKIPEGINYQRPIQIDSSENYIIASMVDKTTKCKYNSEPSQEYYYQQNKNLPFYTNVKIYNTVKRQTSVLFSMSPISVMPFTGNYITTGYTLGGITYNHGGYKESLSSGYIKDKLLFLVKTDEYNKDGFINEDDPLNIFICSKDGSNLIQLGSKEMNVTSFNWSLDGKTLIIVTQKDKNGNKKFTDEDEMLYQVDLSDDISKIKISAIYNYGVRRTTK